MKKTVLLLLLLSVTVFLAAELTYDIPFEMDIVGDSHADVGNYQYVSEWMTFTNTGTTTQDYNIEFNTTNVPEDWTLAVCNTSVCYMPNVSFSLISGGLAAGESIQIHIDIHVNSTGSFSFPITFTEGDLDSPLRLDFTFATADASQSSDEDLMINNNISNYPNPFNPETTISFSTTKPIQNGKIEIFNARGQKVEELKAITNSVVWKAEGKTSGIYFYRLVSDNANSKMKKMTLMK